jgi:hypothetical protein
LPGARNHQKILLSQKVTGLGCIDAGRQKQCGGRAPP